MMIAIAARHQEKLTLFRAHLSSSLHELLWVPNADAFESCKDADGFIDLEGSTLDYRHISGPLLVHHPNKCLHELKIAQHNVARFCAWPGFIERDCWEVAFNTAELPVALQQLLTALNRQWIVVADSPGLIAPRILCMIINEACYALHEGITDEAQLDVAMKLGTNYPEGPVAWGRNIGAAPIIDMLTTLAEQDARYQPHPALKKFLA